MKNNWFKIISLVQDVRCSSFINVSRNESHAPLPIFHVPGIWWGSFSGDGISEQNLESPLLLLFVLSQFFFFTQSKLIFLIEHNATQASQSSVHFDMFKIESIFPLL